MNSDLTRAADRYERWAAGLTTETLRRQFRDLGCTLVIVKSMGANNNSKQQVFLANQLNTLADLPFGSPQPQPGSSQKKGAPQAIFHCQLAFSWLTPDGPVPAPHAKLVYYPQYPEVRLSGFLRGCRSAPGHLMRVEERGKEEGRLLLLGVNPEASTVFGLVVGRGCPLVKAVEGMRLERRGVLMTWPLLSPIARDPQSLVLAELCLIAKRGWVLGQRLTRSGLKPYTAENGGGYTIESLLGIVSNSKAAPDYHGYEVKSFDVGRLDRPRGKDVTLFDVVPDGGEYTRLGAADFVRTFGHRAPEGTRYDFTGRHRVGHPPPRTGAALRVLGYDGSNMRADGRVAVVGANGDVLMEWSFAKLIDHWGRKHALAVYVPSEKRKSADEAGSRPEYRYGQSVMLGTGTDFTLFLDAVVSGEIRYDPGMHAHAVSVAEPAKVRSLFRIHSWSLHLLYNSFDKVDACAPAS